MNDVMKIVKSLDLLINLFIYLFTSLLIKGISKTIKNEAKE